VPSSAGKPYVIPVFITNEGCPHRCLFCDQGAITGEPRGPSGTVTANDVAATILQALSRPRKSPDREVQVAFYGGSFTGLVRERQKELLGAVRPFLREGRVQAIRLSTRPDYVDEETGLFLGSQGVRVVELGVQSLDPVVLSATRRGYSADRVTEAFTLLKPSGLIIGGQLMIGLPGESMAGLLASARRLAALGPEFVRLYPTLVLSGSGLAGLYREGQYLPLSLARAVVKTARVKQIFDEQGIRVIRMGLQPSASLEASLLAGPYHPAFGELVLSHLFFRRVRAGIAKHSRHGLVKVIIAAQDESIFRGPGNNNMKRLARMGVLDRITLVLDARKPRFFFRIEKV